MLLPVLNIDSRDLPDGPIVTISLPIETEERDIRQPLDRLKDLLRAAGDQMEQRGLDKRDREAVLDTAREAVQSLDLRTHRDPGLVLVAARGFSRVLPLPQAVPESVTVGRQINLKPLLPVLRDRPFHLLAVSAGRVRLLECHEFGFRDVTPPELHISETDVIDESDYQPTVQTGPTGRPGTAKRSQGGMVQSQTYEAPDEVRKAELIEYLRRVADRVEAALAAQSLPVVIAAEPEIAGHLRKLLHLRRKLDQALIVNPFGIDERELVERARPLVPSPERQALADALDRINARLGTADPKVTLRLEEIIGAAQDGRVDTVVVSESESVWGRFDSETRVLTAHGTPTAGDEELLNAVVVATLEKGGQVLCAARDELPRQALAAAILRY
jgi:hypothetical protein